MPRSRSSGRCSRRARGGGRAARRRGRDRRRCCADDRARSGPSGCTPCAPAAARARARAGAGALRERARASAAARRSRREPYRRVLRALARPDAHNAYGPTEAASVAAFAMDARPDTRRGRCRSGARSRTLRPTCSTRGSAPLPVGVPGELLHRRRAVAPRLPRAPGADRRALRARSVRRAPGARLYRTGDRARWRPDGDARVPRPRSTTRSRCAASASSSARSRPRSARTPAFAAAVVALRRRARGDEQLVAYVVRAAPAATTALRARPRRAAPAT